jgi:hypothetical protein
VRLHKLSSLVRVSARFGIVAVLALLSLAGCAGTLPMRAPVLYPARVPVRAFPTILIAGVKLPEGDLSERLRAHLAKGGEREVRTIDVAELEPMREAGTLSPLTVVLTIEPAISSEVRQQMTYASVPYCTAFGCFMDFQPVPSRFEQIVGDVLLTVYEGPTARVLQAERFQVVLDAPNTKPMRTLVFEQLAREVTLAMDVLKSEARVELEPVDRPSAARDGVAQLRRGALSEGRRSLEQAAKQLGGYKKHEQARVWYDLAIARWLAPGELGLTQAAFEDARRALKLAIALDDSPRYRATLKQLESARQRQAVLDAQRKATQHNFALKAASAQAR